MSDGDRHSKAEDAHLITDEQARAEREALNGLRQFSVVADMVADFTQRDKKFRLRLSMILTLHRCALEDISSYAGNFRPADIYIGGSKHQPPPAFIVPEEVEKLCDYVNENWDRTALHLAAYILWKLNWIHPFTDGNGRTSRALSYAVLCIRLGYLLPGSFTIPEQISENKKPYYDALEKADEALATTQKVDVSALEVMLESMLAAQLYRVHQDATKVH